MPNPYQSPADSPRRELRPSPLWYQIFYHLYRPAWYVGLSMIVASWFDVVTPTVGWYGFGVIAAIWLASKVLPSIAGARNSEVLILDSRSLRARDEIYHHAIKRLSEGEWLMYDGVSFAYWDDTQLVCSLPSPTQQIEESVARELVDHGLAVFEELKSAAPEFASAVTGRQLYVLVSYRRNESVQELCRMIDGEFEMTGAKTA